MNDFLKFITWSSIVDSKQIIPTSFSNITTSLLAQQHGYEKAN
jgi:hypothetical protein